MRKLLSKLLLLLLVALQPAVAAEDFLLTGVIASSGGGKAFAVIEQADGQQRLVSEGDPIGKGTVELIDTTANTVSLAFPDGNRLLTLRGSAFPEQYREEFLVENYLDSAGEYVLAAQAQRELLALAAARPALSEQQSSARLNALLGLAEDARIAGFNHQRMDSSKQLLQALATALQGEHQGTVLGAIAVADAQGNRRIYLSSP